MAKIYGQIYWSNIELYELEGLSITTKAQTNFVLAPSLHFCFYRNLMEYVKKTHELSIPHTMKFLSLDLPPTQLHTTSKRCTP